MSIGQKVRLTGFNWYSGQKGEVTAISGERCTVRITDGREVSVPTFVTREV